MATLWLWSCSWLWSWSWLDGIRFDPTRQMPAVQAVWWQGSGGGGGGAAEGEAGGGDGGPGNAAVAQLRPHTDRVLLVSQVVAGVVVEGLDVAAGPSEVLRSENFFITSTTHLQPLAGSSLLSRKTGAMS